jgi:hypothetical protein
MEVLAVTTAVPRTPLSESELRELAEAWFERPAYEGETPPASQFEEATTWGFGFYATDGDEGVWRDLRPSEDERLTEILDEHTRPATEQARRVIIDAIVAAGVEFQREHPETPRESSGARDDENARRAGAAH